MDVQSSSYKWISSNPSSRGLNSDEPRRKESEENKAPHLSKSLSNGEYQVSVSTETGSEKADTPREEGVGIIRKFTSLFKRERKWTCEGCTLSNSNNSDVCEDCGKSRPVSGLRSLRKLPGFIAQAWRRRSVNISNDESMQWTCVRCGFKNHPLIEYCENCREPSSQNVTPVDRFHRHDNPTQSTEAEIHHISHVYDNLSLELNGTSEVDMMADSLRLDSPTQFFTGSFANTKSLSVQQRRNLDENEARDQVKHIVTMCLQTGARFVDPDFRPDYSSITVDGRVSDRRMWKIAKWLRPDQIKDMERNPAPWQVFRTPRPSDIHQGALGNCWFLSALAVMAEAPELVEQILVTKDYSSEGVYQVRLCKNGRWIIVTIDDLFPCTSSNNLVFSQARRKQLWVPLIEKGIAKLFGSYEALHAGTIQEGLSLLTGVACEEIEVGSFDAIEGQMIGDTDCELLWATLLSYKEAGFLVAAACGSKEGSDDTEEQMYVNHGLMPSHAYSVLDVKMIQQDVGKPLRLIRLRNPWGRFSWNGLWSDTSPVWRDFPQLRNDLMPCGAEEGIFWMQWDDFVRYFYRIVVCKYRPDWLCESIQGSLLPPGKLKVMSLEILTPTEVDICLYQNSTRGQGFLEPWNLWIIVVKCDPPSFVTKSDVVFSSPKSFIFQSNCTSQDCVSCTGWLDPGFYAVIPFSFLSWQDAIHLEDADELSVSVKSKAGRNRDYLLSVFSSRPLLLDKVGLLPGFTARAIYMLAKKIGRKSEFTKFACMYHVSVPRICRMAVVENRCNSHITVTTDASESYNIASTRGSLHTVDVLPPDHWQVLWAFSRPVETAAYALTLKMEYKLTPNNPEGKWGAVHTPSYPRHLQEFHQVYPIA